MTLIISNYPPARRRVLRPAPVTKEDIPRDTSRSEHPTSTPFGLKRVVGAIGKRISVLKATVAKFKKMRLPPRRLSIFSTKEVTPSQTDRPLQVLAEQSKTTKGPLLPESSSHSLEEVPQLEKVPFKVIETPLSSGSEAQVKQMVSMGSGPVSGDDVVRHGEVAPPKATPEVRLPSVLE